MVKAIQEIPGPAPYDNFFKVLKIMRQFNGDALGMLAKTKAEYGDLYLLEILGNKQVFVSEPELAREVLVTKARHFHKADDYKDKNKGLARFLGDGILVTDGEFWKQQRKLVTPAFHTSRITEYADTMTRYTEEMLSSWSTGGEKDIAEELMHLTLRIVAQTLFNTDVRQNADEMARAMEVVNNVAGKFSIVPAWMPTPDEIRTRRALRELDAYIYDLIRERRQDETDTGDLLSMLMLTQSENGTRMTDKQVRDEAVTLFLAGHETTANALNWTFWLLSQHPEAEAKLHAELDTVLGGRTPTLADLPQLRYTEMVIKESMRWMPPVSGIARAVVEDVELGGYLLPQGTQVLIDIYNIHRHVDFWEQPLQFQPERFYEEAEKDRHRYAYLPFGGGARICVGFNFAMMEAVLLLATIAQNYTLRLRPDHEVIPVAQVTTYPKGGLPMTVAERQLIFQASMAPLE